MIYYTPIGQPAETPPPSTLVADSSCQLVFARRPVRDVLTLATLTRPLLAAINVKEGRADDPMIAKVVAFLDRHASHSREEPATSIDPAEADELCSFVSNAYVRGEAYLRAGQGTPAIQLAWTMLDDTLRKMEPVDIAKHPTAPGFTFVTGLAAAGALGAFVSLAWYFFIGRHR
jgi:hypothetical protein